MNKNILAIFAAMTLLMVLGACSSDESADDASSPTSVATSDPAGATYGTVEELKDAAVAAGLKCSTWTLNDPGPNVAGVGECDEMESILAIYLSDDAKQDTVDALVKSCEMAAGAGLPCPPLLVGPDWIINSPQSVELQPALGGVIQNS